MPDPKPDEGGWIHMRRPGDDDTTEGTVRVADSPDVIESFTRRGYTAVDPPEAPPLPDAVDTPDPWVLLAHPGINGLAAWPNNPEALAGAYAKGWEIAPAPEPEDDDEDDPDDDDPTGTDAPAKAKPAKSRRRRTTPTTDPSSEPTPAEDGVADHG